jgi:hypothetical protein
MMKEIVVCGVEEGQIVGKKQQERRANALQ